MQYKKEKDFAIKLRKEGFSYSEILKKIPVAKSTLSLWLRSVNLSKKQNQRLTEKKILAQKRGAKARKNIRISQTQDIFNKTKNDLGEILKDGLWLAGIMLYWAEGAKQKENNPSSPIRFSNMDDKMIRLFVEWSKNYLGIKKEDITYDLYIHESGNMEKSLNYWTNRLGCRESNIRVYLKRSKLKTNRKNIGENYYGVIRINIKKSSALNRKISSWASHLCSHWGIV